MNDFSGVTLIAADGRKQLFSPSHLFSLPFPSVPPLSSNPLRCQQWKGFAHLSPLTDRVTYLLSAQKVALFKLPVSQPSGPIMEASLRVKVEDPLYLFPPACIRAELSLFDLPSCKGSAAEWIDPHSFLGS